jgi:TatD DNase family protein
MWIDAHAHLYDFTDNDLDGLIDRARAAGVDSIVNAGTNLASSRRVCEQCRNHPGLHAAVGISPFDVSELSPRWPSAFERLLETPGVVAVGETGLDDTNPAYPPLRRQIPLFERLLHFARDRHLPIVVHSRGAERKVVDLCRAHDVSKVLLHCYTGEPAILREALERGWYVSFSGIATFKKAPLDELIAITPLERLFIETDTPYLAPVPHRGKPNEPAYLPLIGDYVARRKGVSPHELAGTIRRSFTALFDRAVTPPSR